MINPPRPIETDAEINGQIRAYEGRTGALFSEHERTNLRLARKTQTADKRIERHPLGHNSEPGHDHRTHANRSAVASVLREYFAGTLERGKMNKPVERSDSHTGAELADRMTSRLEVANALVGLHRNHLNLWLAVVREYRDGLSRTEIAERWRKSEKTVKREIEEGLDLLIERIFIDVVGQRAE